MSAFKECADNTVLCKVRLNRLDNIINSGLNNKLWQDVLSRKICVFLRIKNKIMYHDEYI